MREDTGDLLAAFCKGLLWPVKIAFETAIKLTVLYVALHWWGIL